MKGKKFLILIIFSLFAINIFTLVRFYQLEQQKDASEVISYSQENNESDELHSYMVNFTTNILNSNIQLDSVMIKDSLSNIIPLKKAFNNGQKQILVCRFSKMHCESCVNFSIQILRKWIDSIGMENVMFLGNYPNNRIFNRTKSLYGIQDMIVYNTSVLQIPAEELGYPYFFVLDNSLRISNVFVPDKATPNITNKYLKNIQKKF